MQESATPAIDSATEARKTTRRVFLAAAGAGVMTAASYVGKTIPRTVGQRAQGRDQSLAESQVVAGFVAVLRDRAPDTRCLG